MQTIEYRIFHSEEGVPKAERAGSSLSLSQVRRELENLPTALHLHFTTSSIEVEAESLSGEPDGVRVTLKSDQTEVEMKNSLVQCIKKLNQQKPGLCLLMERLPSS